MSWLKWTKFKLFVIFRVLYIIFLWKDEICIIWPMFHRVHLIAITLYSQKRRRLTIVRRRSNSVVSLCEHSTQKDDRLSSIKMFRDCVWCQWKVPGVYTALQDKDLKKSRWLYLAGTSSRTYIGFCVCSYLFLHII